MRRDKMKKSAILVMLFLTMLVTLHAWEYSGVLEIDGVYLPHATMEIVEHRLVLGQTAAQILIVTSPGVRTTTDEEGRFSFSYQFKGEPDSLLGLRLHVSVNGFPIHRSPLPYHPEKKPPLSSLERIDLRGPDRTSISDSEWFAQEIQQAMRTLYKSAPKPDLSLQTLHIRSNLQDVHVTLNGTPVGKTPIQISVMVHTDDPPILLVAEKEGFSPMEMTIPTELLVQSPEGVKIEFVF